MSKCKLILIEGIPGSGKTTLATYVKKLLDERGIANRLNCEGDLEHPADFESVAHFSRPDYEAFLARHAPQRKLLEQNTVMSGDDCFLGYRKLRPVNGQAVTDELVAELAQHDVYETPRADDYCRLAAKRWQDFAQRAVSAEEVSIFECCFLQNPLTVILGKHNMPVPYAIRHIQRVAESIRPLEPVVIYLWQQDTRAAMERIAQERPQAWKDFLIAYFTGQEWGRATGASGFEGVIDFYDMRKQVEMGMLEELPADKLLIDNTHYNWLESEKAVARLISTVFETD